MSSYINLEHPGGGESLFFASIILTTWKCNMPSSWLWLCHAHLPLHLSFPQRVCVPDSKSHRAGIHSSRHHWQWSISCSEWLQEPSTSLVSRHHGRHSRSHQPDLETFQSLQSADVIIVINRTDLHIEDPNFTLQMLSFETRTFLAARSL